MYDDIILESFFQALITGDRAASRQVVADVRKTGETAESLAHDLFWPTLEAVNRLFRADQLSTLAHHYAIRLLRSHIDQAQMSYTQNDRRGRKILMFSGDSEADELAGLMTADLIEADGYEIYFAGGGIANDEILAEVGKHDPDVLLMFASGPSDAPHIREIIDRIKTINSCPDLQVVVGGGVFARAEGLAEEIGADLWAMDPAELIHKLEHDADRRATSEQRTVGRTKRTPRAEAA